MLKETIIRCLHGHFTRQELKMRYLPAVGIIISSSLLAAWLLYPPELHYSIFTNTISDLGDWSTNTSGWWGFAVAMWVMGSSFVPLYLYVHRRLTPMRPKETRAGTFFSLVGCVCIFCIGIFDDVDLPIAGALLWSDFHTVFDIVGFSCLGLGIAFHGRALGKGEKIPARQEQNAGAKRFIPPHWLMSCLGIATGISLIFKIVLYPGLGLVSPGLTSTTFWEWLILGGMIAYVFWLIIILPEEIPEK